VRILIIGAPGAGTTTLGRATAAQIGAGFIDADDYFWLPTEPPYKIEQAHPARLESILRALSVFPSAVVAGSIVEWGAELEDSFSLIVYLWVPAEIRVRRLVDRETARFGKPQEGFIDWAAQYDEGRLPGRSRLIHQQWLLKRRCPILRIEGDIALEQAMQRLHQALSNKALEVGRVA
jgi:adenylate kinase family enzyme